MMESCPSEDIRAMLVRWQDMVEQGAESSLADGI